MGAGAMGEASTMSASTIFGFLIFLIFLALFLALFLAERTMCDDGVAVAEVDDEAAVAAAASVALALRFLSFFSKIFGASTRMAPGESGWQSIHNVRLRG